MANIPAKSLHPNDWAYSHGHPIFSDRAIVEPRGRNLVCIDTGRWHCNVTQLVLSAPTVSHLQDHALTSNHVSMEWPVPTL